MRIKYVKTDAAAVEPKRGTVDSAGYDLFATSEVVLAPGETRKIELGLKLIIPKGFYGAVCSRSGLALKQGIFVLNAPGIIDADYRGEVGVILHNSSGSTQTIPVGKAVAQLVIQRFEECYFDEITESAMDMTARGNGGFGSTC